MTIAYFDCFAGAGGDMIVAALLDAGCDADALKAHLAKLQLEGYELQIACLQRDGLAAKSFTVQLHPELPQPHRRLADILETLQQSDLPQRVTDRAERIFCRLAEAEAKVHGIAVEEVHFHEVGAIDSILDVVGACVALELLEVESVFCSALPVGSGTIQCSHGQLPVPAPATAELLVGAKTASSDLAGELTTPTAAAILTTLAEGYGPIPAMCITSVGCGAGQRAQGPIANILRVFLGEEEQYGQVDTVVELSANVDDCTGEVLGGTIDKLLAAGCLDAWATPIYMKKSRPAWMICVLAREADAEQAEQILFMETTTFGIRRRYVQRSKLLRQHQTVETSYGPIRIKVGRRGAYELTASPEFADAQAAAEAHHVPVREVLAAAMACYRAEQKK